MRYSVERDPIRTENDTYYLQQIISSSETSRVFLCLAESEPRLLRVAKLFNPFALSYEQELRVANEIRAICSINHPNVIRGVEAISYEQSSGFIMEYAAGGSLAQRLTVQVQFSVSEALRIAIELCCGLGAIHSAGFVHRGLQPSNILFTEDNSVKITDFGFVREIRATRLTQGGDLLGAVDYASPEYVECGMLDRRSDVYALGALLFKMLTGLPLFPAATVVDSLMLRLTSEPPLAHTLTESCPPELSAIISRALNRNPFARYESPRAMMEDLWHLVSPGECVPSAAPDVWAHQVGLLADSISDQEGKNEDVQRVYFTTLEHIGDRVLNLADSAYFTATAIAKDFDTQAFLLQTEARLRAVFLRERSIKSSWAALKPLEAGLRSLASNFFGSRMADAWLKWLIGCVIVSNIFLLGYITYGQLACSGAGCESSRISNQVKAALPAPAVKLSERPIEPAAPAAKRKVYQVISGDTLSKIGERFNVPVKSLKQENALKNENQLRAGMVLQIPQT